MFIDCPQAVMAGSWIRGLSRVEHLEVGAHAISPNSNVPPTPLVPFRGFSPVIKSFHVDIAAPPPSQIINLILSFPLLEDLAVIVDRGISDDTGDGSKEMRR
jgi:hypothetical protein